MIDWVFWRHELSERLNSRVDGATEMDGEEPEKGGTLLINGIRQEVVTCSHFLVRSASPCKTHLFVKQYKRYPPKSLKVILTYGQCLSDTHKE